MIAILTKYIAPTNTLGARIKAYTDNGKFSYKVTISYDYSLDGVDAHFKAVEALIKKHGLDWDIENMSYGSTWQGYAFCFANSKRGVK